MKRFLEGLQWKLTFQMSKVLEGGIKCVWNTHCGIIIRVYDGEDEGSIKQPIQSFPLHLRIVHWVKSFLPALTTVNF